MDDDGSERDQDLGERIAALENRLEIVEARLFASSPPAVSMTAPSTPVGAPQNLWAVSGRHTPSAQPATEAAAIAAGTLPGPAIEPLHGRQAGTASRMASADLGRLAADLEDRLTGRALAWVGGAALILGAIFFISLAFSRGWIGPEGRVAIGLVAGALAIAGGGLLLDRGDRLIGHVLTPVGLAIVSTSLVGATRLYGLVPTEVGLAGAFLSAVAAAVIAIRADSQAVAGFGLVTVLAAPPLLGASPDLSTLAFVGVALIGTTIIALVRTWPWLPPIAFLLSAPQAAAWFGGQPSVMPALVALATFWGLHALAAGGEEFLRHRNTLSSRSASLLLADAAFLVWAGFTVLSGDLESYRGAFLLVVALAHAGLGGYFIVRHGDQHLFGLLALGTGIAALTMAIPVQLGGPPVPIAWTAEAAALAWVAAMRWHPFSLATSAALFGLAAVHLVSFEFPLEGFGGAMAMPFLDGRGGALAFFLLGLAVAVVVLPERRPRSWAVAVGLVVTAWAVGSELRDVPSIAGWSLLTVIGAAIWRGLPRLPERPIAWTMDGLVPQWLRPGGTTHKLSDRAVPAAASAIAAVAIGRALVNELPLASFGNVMPPPVPFSDGGALTAAILVGAALACGIVVGGRMARRAALLGAGAIVAYTIPYEVYAWAVAVLWSAIAVAGFAVAVLDRGGRRLFLLGGAAILGAAALVAVFIVAPPTRFVVQDSRIDHPFLVSEASAALVAVVLALATLAWLNRSERWARLAGVSAGVLVVYLLSVGIVDAFAGQVGGPVAFEELQKQAQVALSVLWAVLGVVGFVAGLLVRRIDLRQTGLGLLALTTLKVFLVDLSSLDVAYRVISLIALGVLLLGSAWAYGRLKPRGPAPTPRGPTAASHRASGDR